VPPIQRDAAKLCTKSIIIGASCLFDAPCPIKLVVASKIIPIIKNPAFSILENACDLFFLNCLNLNNDRPRRINEITDRSINTVPNLVPSTSIMLPLIAIA
jgi:hypothetical protein